MKIAYFSSRYLPRFKGGTESITHLLAKGMQARGHDVRVVSVESTESGQGSAISGIDDHFENVPVHRISYNWSAQASPFRALTMNSSMESYLDQWIQIEKPDLVHVTNCFRITAAALTAPLERKVPVVMTLTEFWFFCPIGSSFNVAGKICPGAEHVSTTDCLTCFVGLSEQLKRMPWGEFFPHRWIARGLDLLDRGNVSRQAVPRRFANCTRALEDRKTLMRHLRNSVDLFLTLNDGEKRYFTDRGFDAARVKTIPLAVAPVPDAARAKVPRNGRIRIGYVGAMVRYKGIETLIDAFRRANLGPQASLDLWGDDKSDAHFRARLVRHIGNTPGIRLRGRFPEGHLDAIFAEMDILAIPSLSLETGPLVLFEALAHHTPALCSNHGGMPQFIKEGVNGFLFEPGNAEDCARVLRRIAENSAVLDQMRETTAQPRSIDQFLSDHEKVYREAASRKTPAEVVTP